MNPTRCLLIAFGFVLTPIQAGSQNVPFTPVCQTFRGVCYINGAGPLGAQCGCGADIGQLIIPPNFGTACGTQFGVCGVPALPMGSFCSCGAAPGRIIGR